MMMNVVGEHTTVGKNRKRPRKDDLKDNTAQPDRRSMKLVWKDKSKKQKDEQEGSSEGVVLHPSITVKKEESKRRYITLMEEEEEEEKKVVKKRYTNCSRINSSNGCLQSDPDAPMSESSSPMDSDSSSDSSTNKRELTYYQKLREGLGVPALYTGSEHENAEGRTLREECEKSRMTIEVAKIRRDSILLSSDSSSSSLSSCDSDESPMVNQDEFDIEMTRRQEINVAAKDLLESEEEGDYSDDGDELKSEKKVSEMDSFSSLDSDESTNGAMGVDDDSDSVTYKMKKTFKNIPVRLTYQPSDEEKLCREAAYPHTGYRCSKQTGNYTSSEMNLGLQLWDRW